MATTDTGALAALITGTAGQPLTDELRADLAERAAGLQIEGARPLMASLERDPADPSSYYVAADGPSPQLLHVSRKGVEARPFASTDQESIRWFAETVNRAFLPRPQRDLPAIAVGNRHPEVSLPAAFEAFRLILKKTGVNMASTVQLSATREMTTDDAIAARDGENPTAAGHTRVSIRHLYHAGLWAAIRGGWREGYNAEADHFIVTGSNAQEIARSVEAAKEAIRHAAGYTKFTTDTSRLVRPRSRPAPPVGLERRGGRPKVRSMFSDEERAWILGEFVKRVAVGDASYDFTRGGRAAAGGEIRREPQTERRAVRLHPPGKIRRQPFDFEPSLDEAETLTTPARADLLHALAEAARAARRSWCRPTWDSRSARRIRWP